MNYIMSYCHFLSFQESRFTISTSAQDYLLLWLNLRCLFKAPSPASSQGKGGNRSNVHTTSCFDVMIINLITCMRDKQINWTGLTKRKTRPEFIGPSIIALTSPLTPLTRRGTFIHTPHIRHHANVLELHVMSANYFASAAQLVRLICW